MELRSCAYAPVLLSALLGFSEAAKTQSTKAQLEARLGKGNASARRSVLLQLARWEAMDSVPAAREQATIGVWMARTAGDRLMEAEFEELLGHLDLDPPASVASFRSAEARFRFVRDLRLEAGSREAWPWFFLSMARLEAQPGRLDLTRMVAYLDEVESLAKREFPSAAIEFEYRYLRQGLLTLRGNAADALRQSVLAEDLARRHGMELNALRIRSRIYFHYASLHRRHKAIELLGQVLADFEREGLRRPMRPMLYHLAIYHLGGGDPDAAEAALNRAERMPAPRAGQEFKIFRLRAATADVREDFDEAVTCANQAVAVSRETGNLEGELDSLSARVSIQIRRSRVDAAQRDAALAAAEVDAVLGLAESRGIRDLDREVGFCESLASIARERKQMEQIVRYSREAKDARAKLVTRRNAEAVARAEESLNFQRQMEGWRAIATSAKDESNLLRFGMIVLGGLGVLCFLWYRSRQRRVERERTVTQDVYDGQAQLIGILSHDLRQPLQALLSYSEIARCEESTSATTIDSIYDSAQSAVTFASQLLALVPRDRSSEAIAALGAVDLLDVARESLPFHNGAAKLRGVVLDVGSESVVLTTSRLAVRIILNNLIYNAIKACSTGDTISICVTRQGAWAELVVRDTGAGMAPASVRALQKGERLESESSGFGLGLTVIRELALRLGGGLEIESRLGVGTVMTLRLRDQREALVSDKVRRREDPRRDQGTA